MEKEIIPRFIEGKKSKTGKKYWSIECHNDPILYTCHREAAVTELSKRFGQKCLVDYSVSADGKWHNIWEFIKELDGDGEPVNAGFDEPVEKVKNQEPPIANINLPVGIAKDGKIVFKEEPTFRSPKEIVACVLTECWATMESGKHDIANPDEVLTTYNFFLENL